MAVPLSDVNYGVLGVLDWLHSTDAVFRASKQYEQHKTFCSLSQYDNLAVTRATQKTISSSSGSKLRVATADESINREAAADKCRESEARSGISATVRRMSGVGLGLAGLVEAGEI